MLTDIHTTAGRTPCVYSLYACVLGIHIDFSLKAWWRPDMSSHCAGAKGLVVREETVSSAKGTVIA